MNKDAFSGFHPAVNLAFFLAALGVTMLVQHPVYLLISFAGGCAYLLYLQGRKGFLRQVGYLVPILVLMTVSAITSIPTLSGTQNPRRRIVNVSPMPTVNW